MTEAQDKVARAICREQCAFYGDPPCWADGGCYPEGCMDRAHLPRTRHQ